MKSAGYAWATAGLLGALALGAAALVYQRSVHAAEARAAAAEEDSLAWVRREFALDAAKLARVEKLHADHQVVCEEHCRAIMANRGKLRRLRVDAAPAEEIAAAEAEARRLDAACRASLAAHVHAVADAIGGAQGRRYLEIILPRVAHFEHGGAPDLQLNPANHPAAHDAHAGH